MYFCAVWSAEDVACVATASTAADSLAGTAKVAVREYEEYDEVKKLYPAVPDKWPAHPPLWVLLSDGKVLGNLTGQRRPEKVVEFVVQRLAARKHSHKD